MSENAVSTVSAFKTNNHWITQNLQQLRQSYGDMWIAVLGEAVIDKDADLHHLVNRLKLSCAQNYCDVAVEYIQPIDASDAASEQET